MTHTLETLLPLLDSPEGLERLRILTAEADGKVPVLACHTHSEISIDRAIKGSGRHLYCPWCKNDLHWEEFPLYTTSLDAIFAAEERLGLHTTLKGYQTWTDAVQSLLAPTDGDPPSIGSIAFLTAAQRCIPFILTSQSIKE